MVPERPQEQTVDFSIDLVDPGYRELLDAPDSPQYVDLAHHLQEQVGASRGGGSSSVHRLSPVPIAKQLRARGRGVRPRPRPISRTPLFLPCFAPRDRIKESYRGVGIMRSFTRIAAGHNR